MSLLLLRTWLTVVSADTYTLSVQCGHEDVVLVFFFSTLLAYHWAFVCVLVYCPC